MIKKPNDVNEVFEKLRKALEDAGNEWISMYGTILSCSWDVGSEILKMNEGHKGLSREIQYSLALIYNAYLNVFSTEAQKIPVADLDYQKKFESNSINQRFAQIVKQLYEICKEEGILDEKD